MEQPEREDLKAYILRAIQIIRPKKLVRIIANIRDGKISLHVLSNSKYDSDSIEELRLIGSEIIANYQTEFITESIISNDDYNEKGKYDRWIDIQI